ncbi:MAG: aminoacyl-tRNA deacylase [Planctomycetota bacterium]|jgi:Ala-tRNA(Pro) deacylase
MRVIKFLDKAKVKYKVTKHQSAFTAQHMAAEEHEPGQNVAKPVIVKVDGEYVMCVLPACYRIDLKALKKQMKAKKVELAKEKEIGKIFDDCDVGAEPPFGNLYDVPTVIDKSLEQDEHILFPGGTHEKAIRMSMADYQKLVEPDVLEFSYHMSS